MSKRSRSESMREEALALFMENRLVEARDLFIQVSSADPSDAEVWFKLGIANFQLSYPNDAEYCFRRVIDLQPGIESAHYNLGRSLEFQGKFDEAITVYRELLKFAPNANTYKNIGLILMQQGKFAEALAIYHEGLSADPENIMLIAAEADIYEKLGEYDKAYERVRPYIGLGKEKTEIALRLASLSRFLDCREEAIQALESLLLKKDWSTNEIVISMHFAVGNLHDAAGNYDRAFYHFKKGNDLAGGTFDSVTYKEGIDSIIRVFDADFVHRAPRASVNTKNLIFIIGMPRSGTTLVEQILSSHPQVFGCGELPDIGIIGNSFRDLLGIQQNYPQGMVNLTTEHCTKLAEQYLRRVRELSNDAEFITDKMPQNFALLGMIAMLFPGAKILNCTRDPLDTCLSCYFQNFRYSKTSLSFTTDLASLGNYYSEYLRLMQHWKSTLDIAIMDVSYEMLVQHQEDVTRQILGFCGLSWDEKCLAFHQSSRGVSTASSNQVREPLYQRSVRRWKHYEKYLDPLKNALHS